MKKQILTALSFAYICTIYSCESTEIEYKFKVSEEQSDILNEFKKAMFEQENVHYSTMEETYLFGPHTLPQYAQIANKLPWLTVSNYLRLRSQPNKKTIITCKSKTITDCTARQEYETILEDEDTMINIYKVLGYGLTEKDKVTVSKHRTKCTRFFKGHQIEIVFDKFTEPEQLSNLGEFCEVELKSKPESIEHGKKILHEFLGFYGFSQIKQYPPYIELAINKPQAIEQCFKSINIDTKKRSFEQIDTKEK